MVASYGMRDKKHSAAAKQKIAKARSGQKHSEETKDKISKSRRLFEKRRKAASYDYYYEDVF